MALPPNLKNMIEGRLTGILASMDAHQNSYISTHNGQYWQGLPTHSVTPKDGEQKLPDVGNQTPKGQDEPWPPGALNAPQPMNIRVDTYDGPFGKGYVVRAYVESEGELWVLTKQGRGNMPTEQDWKVVKTPGRIL